MNKPFLNILVISCLIFLPSKAFSIENNNGQTYDSLLEKLNKLSKLPAADRDGVKWKLQNESLFKELQQHARDVGLTCSLVSDAGLTEVPPGTITCLGIGPALTNEIDEITKELKLL